jgi:hypothetical protein
VPPSPALTGEKRKVKGTMTKHMIALKAKRSI